MKTGDNSHTLKSILPPKISSPTSAASGLDHVAMRGCGARWPARARHMGAEQDRSDTGSCSKRGRREGRHCEKHIIDPKNCGSGRCRVPRLVRVSLYYYSLLLLFTTTFTTTRCRVPRLRACKLYSSREAAIQPVARATSGGTCNARTLGWHP